METLAEVDIKTKRPGKLDILKPQKKYFSLSDVTGKKGLGEGHSNAKITLKLYATAAVLFLTYWKDASRTAFYTSLLFP